MLRLIFIATVSAAQAIGSLSGLTLCLHHDGGYCLETPASGCCGHHEGAAADSCCGGEDDKSPASGAVQEVPCDCTHVAFFGSPVLSNQSRVQDTWTVRPDAAATAVDWMPDLAVSVVHGGQVSLEQAATCPDGALLFLAPVMLRC